MTDSTTYNVILNGEHQAGFDADEVSNAFATLFKITPEKAGAILKGRQIIKKGIDRTTAELYKKKLEAIGLIVTLGECMPQAAAGDALTLSPVTKDVPVDQRSGTMSCPKCHAEQPSGTQKCSNCGVFMHKLASRTNAQPVQMAGNEESYSVANRVNGESLSAKSLGVGTATAMVGALIWSFIANMIGLELGLVAWGIGAAIGFAVYASGSSGLKSGIACGILAVAAILGGKYLIYSGMQEKLVAEVAGRQEQIHAIYDNEMEAAQVYAGVVDDRSRRQFMIDYQYTESPVVSDEELESFMENDGLRLSSYADYQPTFDDWYQDNVIGKLENISIFALIKHDLGIIDIAFFLFGVASAFRLGRGEFV